MNKSKNYEIINIDITYIGEIPKIEKHRSEILQNLANMLKIDSEKNFLQSNDDR